MKNQFEILQPWINQILNVIKKDIKSEHLGSDPLFYKNYFGNRPQNRLTSEEIFIAYEKELLKGNEDLAEWIVNRWVFKHGDLYTHFAEKLSQILPDFDQIEALDEHQSEQVLHGAVANFGALPTYLFSVLNGVVFPEAILKKLRQEAEREEAVKKAEATAVAEKQSFEQLIARHEREMQRLQEKYESRLAGVQKKYDTDVAALKKQIRSLQQKLHAHAQP